jgi:ribosomal protein S18 acetylase RimI-like enzyme
MTIRPYRESDREVIKRITIEAFENVSIDQNIERHFGPVGGHDWRWRKGRHVDDDIDAAGSAIWVAEDENHEIVGYISTRMDREAGVGFIPNLAVRGGRRGAGIGRQLIERAIDEFRDAGLALARIETLDQNPIGQHLYPSCGFVEVARQIHFAQKL